MASFTLIREITSLLRDKGSKRIMLGLYQAEDADRTTRYLACSEQTRADEDSVWVSSRKGITIRASEVSSIISALQSADFDAKSDNKGLSDKAYAETLDWS